MTARLLFNDFLQTSTVYASAGAVAGYLLLPIGISGGAIVGLTSGAVVTLGLLAGHVVAHISRPKAASLYAAVALCANLAFSLLAAAYVGVKVAAILFSATLGFKGAFFIVLLGFAARVVVWKILPRLASLQGQAAPSPSALQQPLASQALEQPPSSFQVAGQAPRPDSSSRPPAGDLAASPPDLSPPVGPKPASPHQASSTQGDDPSALEATSAFQAPLEALPTEGETSEQDYLLAEQRKYETKLGALQEAASRLTAMRTAGDQTAALLLENERQQVLAEKGLAWTRRQLSSITQ